MTNGNIYLTTAIPYVNAAPHLGHALELVQADVLARHYRARGRPVRFLTGTDDNALKNVTAAQAHGVPVHDFVDANASRFAQLRAPLDLSFDDFIRTGSDLRHRVGVERLWRQCADRGDFYRHRYEGLYCAGCEQFYDPVELPNGVCPEHHVALEPVSEENWFFRLTRYAAQIEALLGSGRVRIEPASRRREVLSLVRSGLRDFSVSRPIERAGGWGIPVPSDPSQVVYVWWDALTNYVTALGYGGDGSAYRHWWVDSKERIHVIGKGITRFHAVYWLALLLSAGQPLPSRIFVHDYLTIDGHKLSKSAGNTVAPEDLVARFGTDALRWWLVREVARQSDTDFTADRLVARADHDLAGGIGNLQNRVLSLVVQHRAGRVPLPAPDCVVEHELQEAYEGLPARVDDALDRFDLRGATDEIWQVVERGNRFVSAERPWELAKAEATGDPTATTRLDTVLCLLVATCRAVATELEPFVPCGSAALRAQLDAEPLARPRPVFPRLNRG